MENNDKLLDFDNKIKKMYHNDVSIRDIENSLNSALINNMNNNLEQNTNTLNFYKYFSRFLLILSFTLLILFIAFIVNKHTF
jgi:hypothetical protein